MKKFFKISLWIIVAAIFVGTFIYLLNNSKEKVVEYTIVTPAFGSLEKSTVLTGKIEPRDEIAIKPQISGIIAEICVEAGDIVRKDDIIAKIKVIPDESTLNSAQNRVDVAQLTLDQTELEYNRTKTLYEKKFVSKEEYEQSYTNFKKAKQELEAAIDALSIVKDGVSSLNAQSSNTLVRATIDGQILEIPVKVGSSVIQANTMNDGTTVATIADMRNLLFKGNVDETEVGLLSSGMPTQITVGAIPDVTYNAVIEYIAPKSIEQNGANTFEMKAAIEIVDSIQLRAGYSANAAVTLQKAEDVMMVPEGVVEWVGDSTYVYVLVNEKPQTFERRPIVTGLSDGVNIEVKSGLDSIANIRGNIKEQ